MKILALEQEVFLNKDIPATISAVSLRTGASPRYEVVYWVEGTRYEIWVDEYELTLKKPKKETIQFKENKGGSVS